MNTNIEELLKRIEFKKQFVEEYQKKCIERAEVFSSYKELSQYCDAKLDAYKSIIADIHDLFPSAITASQDV
ncbi:hypothetical protein [Lysinibacillus antri]|uniref:Uncharacterized protein n=1 Tax=Lysinibacillus antri TaxID=2498145 RepID=A0A3S0P8N6_9BACI|nr:hypothetical protein [Lysinibacillus antri]RUL54019.1 hypothetical protein EK386_07780 [Lysinibacillus antri]